MGSSSGIGKTTICEGLLSQFLAHGYKPEQLAYIKPMTQCIDKQSVTEFCERQHIAHRSIGSLVFKKSFTKDFIDGLTKSSDTLLNEILAEITQIGENKQAVIIDGMGNPSTGSVVGVSNVDIARSLAAPVLFIGKAGVGSAVDDTVLAVSFMQQGGIKNIALAYNKIDASELVTVKHYVNKRIKGLLPHIPILDFIANHKPLDDETKQNSAAKIYQWINSLVFN